MNKSLGFTLIELVMVIVILGILAAVAIPKFISLGTDARVVSLKSLAASLKTTANMTHAKCIVTPACNPDSASQGLYMDGIGYYLKYGWPDAGDELGTLQIDSLIDHEGYNLSLVDHKRTMFAIDGAPDEANCSVVYQDAYDSFNQFITVTIKDTGC